MCTVSVIPLLRGFRLACNRDELLARPVGLPPVVRRFGEHDALLPVDPVSDGTWIAATDAGMALALLNVNPSRPRAAAESPRLSRGTIIPSLLHSDNTDDALSCARAIDPFDHLPFRLIVIDQESCGEVYSNGRQLRLTSRPFDGAPIMLTSSGLGDDLVESPRRMLFDRMIRWSEACPNRQDEFHAHQWPDRPYLSVRMNRAEARTVSRTVIEVDDNVAWLRYVADEGEFVARLELRQLQSQ